MRKILMSILILSIELQRKTLVALQEKQYLKSGKENVFIALTRFK